MTDIFAIKCNNVTKSYRLYQKPSDRLKEMLLRRCFHNAFTAVQDISFSVFKGGTLGIIGENGAGKSTLLKLLAGTVCPTAGTIDICGRVAAILELGSGFHSEFTGRKNIYLNASLLGMSHAEIQKCEQSIIDFSELGSFIDQPVKIYSSGMYVRLAFSVAISVNPEILIIDEALSVGDQRFQKKCIDRMMSFRKKNKTIVFCSHSMYHVSELCETVLWLDNGKVRDIGNKSRIIEEYGKWSERKQKKNEETVTANNEAPIVKIRNVEIIGSNGKQIKSVERGDNLRGVIHLESTEERYVHIGAGFRMISGDNIFGVTTKTDKIEPLKIEGSRKIEIVFPDIPFIGSAFQVFGVVLDEHALHIYDLKLSESIDVVKSTGAYGTVYMEHKWQF